MYSGVSTNYVAHPTVLLVLGLRRCSETLFAVLGGLGELKGLGESVSQPAEKHLDGTPTPPPSFSSSSERGEGSLNLSNRLLAT